MGVSRVHFWKHKMWMLIQITMLNMQILKQAGAQDTILAVRINVEFIRIEMASLIRELGDISCGLSLEWEEKSS